MDQAQQAAARTGGAASTSESVLETIFREGERGDELYVIRRGQVQIRAGESRGGPRR